MRRVLLLWLGLTACAQPLRAQTHVYVAGDAFADITRFSHVIAPDNATQTRSDPPDGIEPGGGGRVGAFFSPAWSLELGVDFGGTHLRSETITYPLPLIPGLIIRPVSYESRATARLATTSMLIGYHPAVSGRIRPGFRGGVSVVHRRDTFTVVSSNYPTGFESGVSSGLIPIGGIVIPTPITSEFTTVSNGLTATVGAEAGISLSGRFAVVPELRLHAGGLGGVVLRPGVSARWTF